MVMNVCVRNITKGDMERAQESSGQQTDREEVLLLEPHAHEEVRVFVYCADVENSCFSEADCVSTDLKATRHQRKFRYNLCRHILIFFQNHISQIFGILLFT